MTQPTNNTHCFAPVLGKRLRITELADDGTIPPDAMQVTTEGFITVTLSSQIEDGAEILQRNANGSICVNEKMADTFKRLNVTVQFCGVLPGALTMTTVAEPYQDANGELAGFTVPESELSEKFALELWTGISGDPSSYGYMLLPFVQGGAIGEEITVDAENAVNFSLSQAYTKGGNQWGSGPYDVVSTGSGPGPLPNLLETDDHLLVMDTSVAPPPSDCGKQPVPS